MLRQFSKSLFSLCAVYCRYQSACMFLGGHRHVFTIRTEYMPFDNSLAATLQQD